ncbi:MAG: PadR family transcriptional regulator [Phycisphaerales bacterium]|nr:PadR family transcriptional regulator [Phycisphaerales bacterium]
MAESTANQAARKGRRGSAGLNTKRGRALSELESFTLGLVWQLGPCSPYEVRRHMRASPSSQWSGSAGAIYPLMRRLEKRKLLESKPARTGKRARREYGITAGGLAALRQWIGPPLPEEAVTVTYDPLRSRARFLGAATPAQRRQWIGEAEEALERIAEMVEKWQASFGGGDEFLRLVTRNGELETEARRRWLMEVAERLG